ncbi:hypothetical protein L1987_19013 [Smallanthus sonchifolius]|uniref:Uncharacterized protein n=1 Tax=Smallanthus sonchifolius TaxID=185202 RepID=A0ACB9J3I6_9ASTR|nr:hypothetical protein L1987_19013 [Smallanthus sonchifolius]
MDTLYVYDREAIAEEVAAILKAPLPTTLKDAMKKVENEKNEAREEARGRDRRVRDNQHDDSDDEPMVFDDVSAEGPLPSENPKKWPSSNNRHNDGSSEQKSKKARDEALKKFDMSSHAISRYMLILYNLSGILPDFFLNMLGEEEDNSSDSDDGDNGVALSGRVFNDFYAEWPLTSENPKKWPSSNNRQNDGWSE